MKNIWIFKWIYPILGLIPAIKMWRETFDFVSCNQVEKEVKTLALNF